MEMRRHCLGALAVLVALRASAQEPAKSGQRLTPASLDRLDGIASVRGRNGAFQRVSLRVRNWIIQDRQRIDRLPETGLLVVHVRAGYVFTTIDGKRRLRGTDQFWTVPAGVAMALETGDDAAILQVVSLRELERPPPPR
jgi:hypothetical protein